MESTNIDTEMTSTINMPPPFAFVVKGYLEYAEEVIRERALIGIDGFTPAQRRILVAMHDIEKIKSNTKCATVVGATMKLHPHGDATIYQTLCKMTDVSERLNIPFIKGKGKFQKIWSNEPSAASRYTECCMMPIIDEYFKDATGTTMIPNYDNSRTEPELLGVSFPSLLCNPTMGVAVGIASNIIPYNFHDVCKATVELIETGKIAKPLIPDFSVNCEYVYNEKELKRIMAKGRGQVKLRGKWHVDGRTIIITQIPYYTTIQRIEKIAKTIDGVSKVKDLSGFIDGQTQLRLSITCSNKEVVDSVLSQLMKTGDLQMTTTANCEIIIDGEPRCVGVVEALVEWVKFRKKVLKRKYTLLLEDAEYQVNRYTYICKLLEDTALCNKFIDALRRSENEAESILRTNLKGIDDSTCNWILDMKLRKFSQLENFRKQLKGAIENRDHIKYVLSDLEAEIVRQLKHLDATYSFPRKTEITSVDYEFTEVKAESFKCIVTVKDKFIVKEALNASTKLLADKRAVECMSDDFILCIDDLGRLLRINLANIPVTPTGNRGVYIPAYCNIADNFNIVDYGAMRERVVDYMYTDGYVSTMNYGQYCGNKKITKVTTSGVPAQTGMICGRFSEDDEYIYVLTTEGRFVFMPNEFIHKSSTARTKFIGGLHKNETIRGCKGVKGEDLLRVMPNFMEHTEKLSTLGANEIFNGEYLAKL